MDQDQECQDIIDKKDYYEILGILKEADDNEIKKAYKKVS
jgi:curved DNA-binding protein CbpA